MAKAAGTKKVTIIPAIHGKLTHDGIVSEPDVYWMVEKWLERHPEVKNRGSSPESVGRNSPF